MLVSAHAVEGMGVNAIPEALADAIAALLDWPVDSGIVQTNIVAHTGAGGFSRLARQAEFDGEVVAGQTYLLVDDFIGQGGILANLRAHLLQQGGSVVGIRFDGQTTFCVSGTDSQHLGSIEVKTWKTT